MIFEYKGKKYPEYLKHGNAAQFILPTAKYFCEGKGLDVGASIWGYPGATPIDLKYGRDALNLPGNDWDFIFSSHCLEHITDPVLALEHWRSKLRPGGVLFLYLPHPDMEYWRPQNCRKHLHIFYPKDTAKMLTDLGFKDVIYGKRDLAWGFACVGFR